TPDSIEQAMALYRGDLLDGISIRADAFEDWLLVERQRLRRLLEEALATLMARAMAVGERDRAEAAARRLLTLDPLRAAAGRALRQRHAGGGETAQALRLYETLRERLRQELGAKPEPETTRLYDAIREHRAPPTAPPPERSMVMPPPLPDKPSVAVLPFE